MKSGRAQVNISDHIAPAPNRKARTVAFIETNPVPIKAALAMKRTILEEYRLPLVKMNPKNREILQRTLEACGILKEL